MELPVSSCGVEEREVSECHLDGTRRRLLPELPAHAAGPTQRSRANSLGNSAHAAGPTQRLRANSIGNPAHGLPTISGAAGSARR